MPHTKSLVTLSHCHIVTLSAMPSSSRTFMRSETSFVRTMPPMQTSAGTWRSTFKESGFSARKLGQSPRTGACPLPESARRRSELSTVVSATHFCCERRSGHAW